MGSAENRFGFGHACHLLQGFASKSFADLSERATLRVGPAQPRWQVHPGNTVLRGQILVLHEQFPLTIDVTYASSRAN